MKTFKSLKTWLTMTVISVGVHLPAAAEEHPAATALTEVTDGKGPQNAVQNRFFLKEGRVEITPTLGYVPSDPLVKRYVGGILGAYHFSETFSAEGAFMYSPDLGAADLKGLTATLVSIPLKDQTSSSDGFQQPVDKMIMGASFAARWAPFYGKINVIGESVLNFDAYGTLGLGMLSLKTYAATGKEEGETVITELQAVDTKVVPTPTIGIGFNFFLNQTMALKLDARSYFYIADEPQYKVGEAVESKRLYNNFVASVGLSFFVPEMKKRMYNF